ncbi:twitching motility protein PilT [Psychrobacter sp. YP14]|uniref:type IV pilus twitching motility protein PilT n=1 Tax=Psychrobacter sp. YP14 TaxID=2203895 RepID=UPI000D7E1E21|nr:PilT/PilU family type 4a pilus ATPase [Psychrobacter sp. YP14]AWT49604.1 twitching motility protein PilT [Psychrobacter sp. YP14]
MIQGIDEVTHANAIDSLTALLRHTQSLKASDLHLSAGMPAMLRIDGEITSTNLPALTHTQIQQYIASTLSPAQMSEFEQHMTLDYALDVADVGRFRVNIFQQHRGIAAVFRAIPDALLSLQQLDLSSDNKATLQQITQLNHGLVLVTGPTGCGKSTTVAALVDHINQTRAAHILTIEDPIEFIYHAKKSLINQREVARHTADYTKALRSALREDPDVIVIGELRDLASIRLALTAAETGHLVLATLHTRSAIKSIDRIVDVFAADEKDMIRFLLSESLQAVISQILIKRPEGGRIAAHEIMMATPAICNMIRQNKLAQMYSAIQTGHSQGMQTLDQALTDLIQRKLISPHSAQHHAKLC